MENPLREFMSSKGWNAKHLSFVLNLDYSTVSGLLNGMPKRLSNRIAHALIPYGCDPEELRDKYEAWRQEEAKKLKESITV